MKTCRLHFYGIIFFAHLCLSAASAAQSPHLVNFVTHRILPFPISVISEEQSVIEFDWLSKRPEIPFRYVDNGCEARAHKMAQLLEERGVISGKIEINPTEGDQSRETFSVHSKNALENQMAIFHYHVAVFVLTSKPDGSVQVSILDPSFFTKPSTQDEWVNKITNFKKHKYILTFTPRFSMFPYRDTEYTVIGFDAIPTKWEDIWLQEMEHRLQRDVRLQQEKEMEKAQSLNH
jgi:hypothetical protein